ncbi:D-alanine--poly(phosphoribitol) ligase subunit 2 [Serratia plymuthica]|jgi:acyl carrier protein|uniref:D-alanine--poly(Phosphoribitol) ligase subunit 2 n=1 Tax=Serratia plymuthica TaxID=82996 RepID=A0A2X4V279_SERPL|nr:MULTISPECIES: phosphopantetheine-binding protein [Serratia]AEF47389.1 hypothetical protein SerAS9_4295 [Serratia plymuthica AS9]AEF52341.1 hypothetical protein SerAS12_4296 [Serratia sp. AS12]AEG30048.1 hypothetical protein SerAS13_4296 [Serratia sp. AS13]MBJ7894030.1 hypothetical protein [Serratia sp. PAMC26656]QPS19132.1 hypothetical protein I6G64_16195 [Serratia plymuthica]
MASPSLDTLTQLFRQFFSARDNINYIEFNANTDLFAAGLLDSLTIVEFVIYLEDLLHKEIPVGDFTLTSIKSVSSVYDHYVLD